MKIFAFLFPVLIVSIGVLVYFSFFGKGAFLLPSEDFIAVPSPNRKLSGSPKEPLTLDQIFDKTTSKANLDGSKIITLIATGDVIPSRSVNFQVVTRKDFTWPYLKTADFIKDADITFINLETPLIKQCPLTQEGMIFCGDYRNVEGLKFAGVDMISLANNHSPNHGKAGVDETITYLKQAGMKITGVNGPEFMKVKDVTFAFLGYSDIEKNPVISTAEEQRIKNEVAEAKSKADVVVVTYHWGTEYKSLPDQRQIDLGHLTIDAGADLVIGNHPHWIQPIELYKGKLITYAHGNYIFDQEWSQKTKEGVIGKYTFEGKDLVDVEYMPLEIKDYGQPYFLEGERKNKILDEMYQESLKIRNSN
jgi:poly-gamma-glutamate capsule biosynthesis protein CapA/YwtB (metallophosphatase superfamily)